MGRQTRVNIVFCLLAYFILSLSLSATHQANFVPDHYLSYDIRAWPFSKQRVTLQDQFIGPMDFIVQHPIQLLNPTLKRHHDKVFEIQNERLHYTAYQLEPSDLVVTKPVVVGNQFGVFQIKEFRPSRLLVPSLKRIYVRDGDPQTVDIKADHYLCYDFPPELISTQTGFLKDQFRARDFEVLVARRLCNPVTKAHNGVFYEIINDSDTNHLMCFSLEKRRILRLVSLLDQFGRKAALVTRDDEICIPSFKREIIGSCDGSLPANGECQGTCTDPTMACLVDATGGSCSCQPHMCGTTPPDANGQCGGMCPTGQVCLLTAVSATCACRPAPAHRPRL